MDDESALSDEELTYLHDLAETHGEDGRRAAEHLSSVYGEFTDVTVSKAKGEGKAGNEKNWEHLKAWWNAGAGGQIIWGKPGDYDKCVRIASKYMDPDKVHGFCQNRHEDATGFPAGKAPAERAAKKGMDVGAEWDRVGAALKAAASKETA